MQGPKKSNPAQSYGHQHVTAIGVGRVKSCRPILTAASFLITLHQGGTQTPMCARRTNPTFLRPIGLGFDGLIC